MSDREKLMKLLADADAAAIEHCDRDCGCVGCECRSVAFCCDAFVVDYLLEHGVTFATDNNGGCKTSKQKTKDILDWVQSTAEVDWGFMCCLKQELEQLVAIASRDDAFGGKWIPVTERLPGCEDVLVVVKSKYDFESQYTIDVDVAAHRFDGGYIDNRWDTFNDWDEGQQYLHVTHWMPLPEPPKGE